MNRSFRNRRGVTSVIAMLFLVLIGTLALGFYTSVTTASALAKNDRRAARALMAAESGIQFMRNRLAHTSIPPATPSANLLNELEADLKADEVIAGNLVGAQVTRNGNVLTIPLILTDSVEQSGFSVTLTDIGAVGEIVCTVKGRSGHGGSISQKGVRLDFTRQPIETNIFDHAVAAKGKLVMQKGSITGVSGVSSDAIIKLVSAQSTNGAFVMSGGSIGSATGGEVGVVIDNDGNGIADTLASTISGGSLHGTSNITTMKNNYVKLVGAPEFPVVDTTQFAAYAINNYNGQNTGTLKNVRIPAGTNPKFTGNVKVQGILYVESPNSIQFQGTSTLEGFIVFENKNSSAQNVINVTGNFGYGNLPSGSEFDALRAVKGFSMLAPTASLQMAGGADSQLRGNMLLGNFRNTGSGDVQIEKGSVITFDTYPVDSAVFNGRTVRFMSTGASNQPSAGLSYSEKFVPSKGSYLELN
jgi:Tfp pilus assembly protein PilX